MPSDTLAKPNHENGTSRRVGVSPNRHAERRPGGMREAGSDERTAGIPQPRQSAAAIRSDHFASCAALPRKLRSLAEDMANRSIDANADESGSATHHHVYLAPNAPRTPFRFSFSPAPTANS
jgi:hypothetical protein